MDFILYSKDVLQALLKPGLESLGFSWIKNSVVSGLFRTGSTD